MTSVSARSALSATLIAVVIAAIGLVALGSGTASAGQACRTFKGEFCVTLTPDPATNPVNTDHTVTAAATVDGDPLGAVFDAGFAVYEGPNAGQGNVYPLGEDGTADFTYTGSGIAGTDSIVTVLCDITVDCENFVNNCVNDGPTCLSAIESTCGGVLRVPAAGIVTVCIGPATALKTWEEPAPSPTPVDVSAGGESPAPTPVQLPASGGTTGDSGNPWALMALLGAAMMLSSGGALVLAWRRVSTR